MSSPADLIQQPLNSLEQLTGRAPERPPLRPSCDPLTKAIDYSPKLSMVANRIVNRGWPGPLVFAATGLRSKQPS